MTVPEELVKNYRVAFLRYLPRREESALTTGYELARAAVTGGVGLLEIAELHHGVVLGVLQGTSEKDVIDVATAASEFFLEVLAPYDMAHRGFLDGVGG